MVIVGKQAVFRCGYPTADFIAWRINETRVSVNSPHKDPGITINTTIDQDRNVVHNLNIVAQFNYNETEVVCIAMVMGRVNQTTPVHLLIQGKLGLTGSLGTVLHCYYFDL